MNFYLARARRIMPALIALCAALMLCGWFFLLSLEYRMLGTHVISALGFISNMLFWREAGYFDVASHEKFLLHTWSLSVEWQFYVLLPLALLAVWKLRPGRTPITIMLMIGLATSLALSILLSPIKQTAAFYLLPTRAWEMFAGGLVYMLANRFMLSGAQQKIIETTGFGLIMASVLLFDASSNWPGWRVLVPVAGAVLILISARQGSLWTGTRVAQWLGSRSYSLYLWHWPIVVVLVHLERSKDQTAIAFGLALTLVFGQLSYFLIENPTRTGLGKLPLKMGIAGLALATLVVAVPSLAVRMENGMPTRLPERIEAISMEASDKNPRSKECFVSGSTPVPGCTYGGKKLGVIVIGDSHAASIMRSVEKALPNKKLHVLDWSLSNCQTILDLKKTNIPGYRCGDFVSWALARQEQLPPDVPLIIMNRTSLAAFGFNEPGRQNRIPDVYFDAPYTARTPEFFRKLRESIIDTACEFAQTRPVYMVRPTPELKLDVPKTMGRALMRGIEREVSISLKEYHQRNAFVWEAQNAAKEKCGVKILDPLPYLCSNGRCNGSKDGIPLFYDDDHLSEHGANELISMFSEVFRQPIATPVSLIHK